MKKNIEIEVIFDDKYIEPKVTIMARAGDTQVENIINAIENASESDYPQIAANLDSRMMFISQRDIVRVYVEGRKVILQTKDEKYSVKKSLGTLEEELNPSRFLRISQSEIINLHKVKCFDFNRAGTIGVEFEGGGKSWASRSRVKAIKQMFKADEG